MSNRDLQAVIFDLDGTLLDTLQDLALSVNAVLRKHSYPEHRVEAYRYFVGEGIETMVQRTLPAVVEEEKLKKLVAEVSQEYSRRWDEHTRPYRGIPEMLDQLEELEIPMSILSNKPHHFTLLTVENLLSLWNFKEVKGVSEETPRKPDPAGALQIAHNFQVNPENIAYLGDTATDMQTAVSAGMYPVGVMWGFRSAEELRENGAQLLVSHPREVEELFF